jgi:hypothetical protein
MGATANRAQSDLRPNFAPYRRSQPFRDAEEAWLWTMAALMARREGARFKANQGLITRPCEPDDVVKCLDGLYRRRRIDLVHARILRIWGSGRPHQIRRFRLRDATGGCGARLSSDSSGHCGPRGLLDDGK